MARFSGKALFASILIIALASFLLLIPLAQPAQGDSDAPAGDAPSIESAPADAATSPGNSPSPSEPLPVATEEATPNPTIETTPTSGATAEPLVEATIEPTVEATVEASASPSIEANETTGETNEAIEATTTPTVDPTPTAEPTTFADENSTANETGNFTVTATPLPLPSIDANSTTEETNSTQAPAPVTAFYHTPNDYQALIDLIANPTATPFVYVTSNADYSPMLEAVPDFAPGTLLYISGGGFSSGSLVLIQLSDSVKQLYEDSVLVDEFSRFYTQYQLLPIGEAIEGNYTANATGTAYNNGEQATTEYDFKDSTATSISVNKTANSTSLVQGQRVRFTINFMYVTGSGTAGANFIVKDSLPSAFSYVSSTSNNSNGVLSVSGNTVTWSFIGSSNDLNIGTRVIITIDAFANGTGAWNNTVNVSSSPIYALSSVNGSTAPSPKVGANKSANSTLLVSLGRVKFTLFANNTGNATVNTTLMDVLPANLTFVAGSAAPYAPNATSGNTLNWYVGFLNPGQSFTVSFDALANGTGAWTNTLNVTTNTSAFNVSQVSGTTQSTIITANKSVNTTTPIVGQRANFTIRTTNTGTAAVNATIVDYLPANFQFVSSTPSAPSVISGNTLTWYRVILPGATYIVSIQALANATGNWTNTMNVTTNTTASASSQVSGANSPVPLANITANKSSNSTSLTEGQRARLTLVAENTGNTQLNTNLTDALPSQFKYITGSASPFEPNTTSGNTLTWRPGILLPGQSFTVSFDVLANGTGAWGNAVNVTTNFTSANASALVNGSTAASPSPVCGDGSINQPSETCDDSNTASGDGCSSACAIEYCSADVVVCEMKTSYNASILCSNTDVSVNNDVQLDAYLLNYGFDGTRYHDLTVNYDVSRTTLEIHSPCEITIDGGKTLTGTTICIDGRDGVSLLTDWTANADKVAVMSENGDAGFGGDSNVNADSLLVYAGLVAGIGQDSVVTLSGPLTVVSTGTDARISRDAVVSAGSIYMEAPDDVTIGDDAVVDAIGGVVLRSTGTASGNSAAITQGSVVTASGVNLISGRTSTLETGIALNVQGNFNMDAGATCSISGSSTVTSGSTSGNCYGSASIDVGPSSACFPDVLGEEAPVLNPIGNKTTSENSTLFFQVSATDADNDALTFTQSGLPSFCSLTDYLNGSANVTCAANFSQAGNYSGITFIVSDGSLTDNETITLFVTNVNRAPLLTKPANQTVAENASLNFALSASDADNNTITYSASGLPSFCTLGASSGVVSCAPGFNNSGNYAINFTASDGDLSDSKLMTLTVVNVNRAPVLSQPANQSVNESSSLSFTLSASDADGDAITYSSAALPAFCALNSTNGTVACSSPGYNDSGNYSINFTASDGNLSNSKAMVLTVINVNRPPVLDPVGSQVVDEAQLLNFLVMSSDLDSEDAGLMVVSQSGLPSFCTFDNSVNGTGNVTCAPGYDDSGVYPVTFTVTDTFGATDFEAITITVDNVNLPPVLDAIGNKFVDEAQILNFDVTSNDADSEDTGLLVVMQSGLPAFCTYANALNGTANVTCSPDYVDSGVYSVLFTVTDFFGATDSETIDINISNVNRPPILNAIGNQSVDENATLAFAITSNDSDTQDAGLLVLNATGMPAFCGFSGNSNGNAMVTCSPSFYDSGVYPVTFDVYDSFGYLASEAINVTVNNVNQLPVLNAIGNQLVDENSTLAFGITSNDNDPQDAGLLALNATGLPAFCGFSGNSNGNATITCSPSFVDSGIYPIIFTTYDSFGAFDLEAINLTVSNVNRPPVLDPVGNQSGDENTTFGFDLTSSDPDSEDTGLLVVSQSSLPGFCTFDNSLNGTANVSCSPSFYDAGVYPLAFTVTDTFGATDSEDVNLTINNVNQAPVLGALSSEAVDENSTLVFAVTGFDPDGGTVFLSSPNLPAFCSLADFNGTANVSCAPGFFDAGTYLVNFTVSDGFLNDTNMTYVIVNNVNRPPVLSPIGNQSFGEGGIFTMNITASDPDLESVSFNSTGLPAFCSLLDYGSGTANVTCAPDFSSAGTYYPIDFSTTDGNLSDSETVAFEVIDVPNLQPGSQGTDIILPSAPSSPGPTSSPEVFTFPGTGAGEPTGPTPQATTSPQPTTSIATPTVAVAASVSPTVTPQSGTTGLFTGIGVFDLLLVLLLILGVLGLYFLSKNKKKKK